MLDLSRYIRKNFRYIYFAMLFSEMSQVA